MAVDVPTTGTVVAVCSAGEHIVSKPVRDSISIVKGVGVSGDAHSGPTVQHLSRKKQRPSAPNLRQVHLIHSEFQAELRAHNVSNLKTRRLIRLPSPDSLHTSSYEGRTLRNRPLMIVYHCTRPPSTCLRRNRP